MKTKNVIIINPNVIPEASTLDPTIHSYVGELQIFVEPHLATKKISAGWVSYYFQNKWNNRTSPTDQILSYKGSTGEKKNLLSQEMLDAIEASTKPVKIKLVNALIRTMYASFFEYIVTSEHRNKNPKTCWNKNNAGGGRLWGKVKGPSIKSYLVTSKILSKMLETLKKLQISVNFHDGSLLTENKKARQLWSEEFREAYDTYCVWKIGSITIKELSELFKLNKYIQCREMDGGNTNRIDQYEKAMLKLTSWFSWEGFVVLLMNKDGSIFKINDGNQGSRSAINVGLPKLPTIEIPYEFWKDMVDAELITLGDDCNIEPDNLGDYTSAGDLERDMLETLSAHDLYTPLRADGSGHMPKFDHPVMLFKFTKHNQIIYNAAKRSITSTFKLKSEETIRTREGSLDFSEAGLKIKYDKDGKRKDNKNRIGYAKERKRIFAKHDNKYSSKNTIKINASAPHFAAKIMQNQVNKFKGTPPKEMLVELEFKNKKAYDKFSTTAKGKLIKNSGFWKRNFIFDIVFESLNPVVK